MREMVKKMITNETADDIKFSKWFWKGAMALNATLSTGKNSKFAKFIGNKILGKLNMKLKVPKVKVNVKAKVPKVKVAVKKPALKLKVKAKKPALKLKVKAKKPALKVKAKAGLKVKVGTKKARRMQTVTTPTGVNADDPKFTANVPQPDKLAGDGQEG